MTGRRRPDQQGFAAVGDPGGFVLTYHALVPVEAVRRAPIPVEMCLSGRDLTEPSIAPQGDVVAFGVRWGRNAAIALVPVDGGPERLLTTEPPPATGRGMSGGCFAWTPDGGAIVYVGADGNLWWQDRTAGSARRLTDVGEGSSLAAPAVSPDGSAVVAALDQAEVWWCTTDGGRRRRIDDGMADFVFDPSWVPSGSGVAWTAWDVPDMPWDHARMVTVTLDDGKVVARHELRPAASIQQVRFQADGRSIAVRDDTGWRNIWTDDEPLVDEPVEHAGPTWGMGARSFAISPDGRQVAFTRNEAGFGRLCVVDVATRDVDEVARGVHGQLTWAGHRLVALRSGARAPTQVVAYDDATWRRTILAVGPGAAWDQIDLPEPDLVRVDHDGVELHARRYAAGDGRTLCWVHGGPTDQWQVEFMPRIAYWWSRGWDVLVPDPRGTSGHGRAYERALQGEWGRLDVDDTAAVLAASHARGWSAPGRTAVMGGSSGGLTALGVLGRHRGLAAGAVVLYPVTDLAVLAEESHRFEAHYTLGLVGPLDDVDRYRAHSPVAVADRIDAPVLIMHGDADPVVPLSSTIAFAERMRAAGGDVELVVMEGEGHGFRDPANRRAEYELTGRFLDRLLGDAESG